MTDESKKKEKKKEKKKDNPIENFFNLEPGSTQIAERETRNTELVNPEDYDEKDKEIEQSYQEIYDKALDLSDILLDEIDEAEAKFVARLVEVNNSLLGTALAAAEKKARLKEHKDKMAHKDTNPRTVNNTLIINREDLLKKIRSDMEDEIIDVESIEITTDEENDTDE